MSFLIGVGIFVVALLVSVMLHEAGHFLTAKRFGMKVTQFFVGFGQTLWSRYRGETEYGIKAIPAGGFVRITGMTSLDEVDPADEPRSFRNQPAGRRLVVLGAGSFMHFVIAFVLLFLVAGGVGLLTESASPTVSAVSACVPARISDSCQHGNPESPARKAGLRVGDRILAVGGTQVHTWSQITTAIKHQPAGALVPVVVARHSDDITFYARLATVRHHGSFLGVSPPEVFQRVSPVSAAAFAGSMFRLVLVDTGSTLAALPRAIPDLFSPNRAKTAGGQLSSVVGAGNFTGQVVEAPVGWQLKTDIVLEIIASLNVFVGIFNLLPLLPLDGGHIAVVLYERARALVARLRHQPDPGQVDYQRLVPLSMGVFAVLVALGLLLIMADIVNPVHITL